MERISGMSFDFYLFGLPIHAESISLSITDNSTVVQTRGIPDGWASGDVAAEGEIELDAKTSQNYQLQPPQWEVIAVYPKRILPSLHNVVGFAIKWKPLAIRLF